MPYDGFTTAAVVRQLCDTIVDGRVERVLSPSFDEIVLLIRTAGRENVRLCLSASSNIPKVNLTSVIKDNPAQPGAVCMHMRKHLTSARIVSATQPDFERVIRIEFDTTDELGYLKKEYLYSEIMGKYSNVILTDGDGRIINAVKAVDMTTSSKRQVLPGMKYEAPPPQDKLIPLSVTKEDFYAAAEKYSDTDADSFFLKAFRGFSPLLSREAAFLAKCSGKPVREHVTALYAVFRRITERTERGEFCPCVIYDGKKPIEYSAFEIAQYGQGYSVKKFDDISACIDGFYSEREHNERIKQRGSDIARILNNAEARIKKKTANQREDLLLCEEAEKFRLYGDLITANLHTLKRGQTKAVLEDYYSEDGGKVEVELDFRLTPSQNAQKYYKKYAKLKTAKEELTKRISMAEKELEYIKTVSDSLMRSENEEDLEQIRAELYSSGYASRMKYDQKKKPQKPKPMHFRTVNGFDVYVGKNNTQNDYLTLKFASRGDWFFHIKNAPGSHVIMVTPDEEPPAEDFTQAAELAAYYSSKRDGENVEVDYTQVKNIKKPAGSVPGFVTYSKNYSATVTPDEKEITALRVKQ